MPPAFNLSQDQTLQLISSSISYKVTQSTLAPSHPPQQSPTSMNRTRLAIHPSLHQDRQPFASCEHFNVSSPHPTDSRPQNRRPRAIPVPTLIGCKLLKSARRAGREPENRGFPACCAVSRTEYCRSAAKRWNYTVLRKFAQPRLHAPGGGSGVRIASPGSTPLPSGRPYFHFRWTQSQSAGARLISVSSARA